MSAPVKPQPEARNWIASVFTLLEDVVYVGMGLLLAASALTRLWAAGPLLSRPGQRQALRWAGRTLPADPAATRCTYNAARSP